MTEPLDLDPIKARAEAASRGPWQRGWPEGNTWVAFLDASGEHGEDDCVVTAPPSAATDGGEIDDAEFIAHARTDVSALIEEVERLRGELDGALERAERLTTALGGGDAGS